ncbi:MAG: SET domain-containing protein [Candidatus Pacearchaeota archaeon]
MVFQMLKKKREKNREEKIEKAESDKAEYVELKKSGIHNKGLFAKKFIPKGTEVIEYTGRKITKRESDEIYEKQLEKHKNDPEVGSVYIFELNKKYDIDGNVPGNIAKYINHSCDPNCETEIVDNKKIVVTALRNIQPGEEITYNYGYDIDNFEDHPCYCGTERCMGYIADEKLWPKLRKKLKEKQKSSS